MIEFLTEEEYRNSDQTDYIQLHKDIDAKYPKGWYVATLKGEVVADAGAADGDAVDKGLALEAVDVIVAGDGGVSGEVVAGGIEGVDVVLGAIIEDIGEGHGAAAEGFVEGIGVEGEASAGAGIARDSALSGKREGGGEVEEVAAMELHRLRRGCHWILSRTGRCRVKLEFYK